MATEAAQLRAAGVMVTLSDGVPRRLVFDFDALYRLEEAAGTLQNWLDQVGEGGYAKRKLWAVSVGLEAGLCRYSDLTLQDDPRYLPTDQVRRRLKFDDILVYLDAVTEAFWQGLGQPATEDEPPDPKAPAPPEGASPGGSSTPPPSSDLAALTTSSGA